MNRYIIAPSASQDLNKIADHFLVINIKAGEKLWLFGLSYATDRVIRDETLIETDITAIFVNCLRSGAN